MTRAGGVLNRARLSGASRDVRREKTAKTQAPSRGRAGERREPEGHGGMSGGWPPRKVPTQSVDAEGKQTSREADGRATSSGHPGDDGASRDASSASQPRQAFKPDTRRRTARGMTIGKGRGVIRASRDCARGQANGSVDGFR